MLAPSKHSQANHSQKTSPNQQVLFLPLTDTQLLAISGVYQDSLPIQLTGTASLSVRTKAQDSLVS